LERCGQDVIRVQRAAYDGLGLRSENGGRGARKGPRDSVKMGRFSLKEPEEVEKGRKEEKR
jgi:hypothetical protein